jgi:recombination protein RecR
MPAQEANAFAQAILKAKESVHYCKECQNLTENDLCPVCADKAPDRGTICVVQTPGDLLAVEKTHGYKGVYHVLHGAISPMDQIGPGDLKIRELLQRVAAQPVDEIILATDPTVEGDATAIYLSKLLKPMNLRVSRLAFGLPIGGDLEYADELTLAKAIENRRDL